MPSLKTVVAPKEVPNNKIKSKKSKKATNAKRDSSEGINAVTSVESPLTTEPVQSPREISSTSPSPTKPKPMTPKKKDTKGQLTLGAFFAPRSNKSSKDKASLKDKPKSGTRNTAKATNGKHKHVDNSKPLLTGKENATAKGRKKSSSNKNTSKPKDGSSVPKTNATGTATASNTKSKNGTVSRSSTRKSKAKSPDKEALLDIVLGAKVDGSKIQSMDTSTAEAALSPSHLDDSSPLPLPRPGIRNLGLSRGKKRDRPSSSSSGSSKLLVTPSPRSLPSSTSNKKTKAASAEDTTSTEEDPVNKNLLVNLEKTMDKKPVVDGETMDGVLDHSNNLNSASKEDEEVEQIAEQVTKQSIAVDDNDTTMTDIEAVDTNNDEESNATEKEAQEEQKHWKDTKECNDTKIDTEKKEKLAKDPSKCVKTEEINANDVQNDSETTTDNTKEEDISGGSKALKNENVVDSAEDKADESDDAQDSTFNSDVSKVYKPDIIDSEIVEKGEITVSKSHNSKKKSEEAGDSKAKANSLLAPSITKKELLEVPSKESGKNADNDVSPKDGVKDTVVDVDAPEGERPKMTSMENIQITDEAKTIIQDKMNSILNHEVQLVVEESIPQEIKLILKKHKSMRSRYSQRAEQLVKRGQDGLSEEDFRLPLPDKLQSKVGDTVNDASPTTPSDILEFPDAAVQPLAVIIQGSRLPLSGLASKGIEMLQQISSCDNGFTTESVSTKIKLLASRESYTGNAAPKSAQPTDVFEDNDRARNWRWELTSLDLLPQESITKVKKARSARRKLRSFWRAVTKLLSLLAEAERVLRTKHKKDHREKLLARISSEEDKVLKFEREEESIRLKEQAKLQKDFMRQKEKEQRQKEKEEAEEKRRKEKAVRDAEKQKKKEETERIKEETKKQKEDEKEKEKKKREDEKRKKDEEAQKEQLEKEAKVKKQKAMMKSFFSTPVTKSLSNSAKSKLNAESDTSAPFDTEKFRSMIDSRKEHISTPLFPNLSKQAIASRKRRTHQVTVSVFVTVMPDNPFAQQPYDEIKDIQVRNKYKFLAFHEDYRPPYHGTWSKPLSSIVTGRKPFGKDTTYLDYDYDSEAEWEEGDEEQGEDCDDAGDEEEENAEDEEGDTRVYNYQDGWLAADDDLGQDDDEIDDETKALRKRKLEASERNESVGGKNGGGATNELSTVCVIAPAMGGMPLIDSSSTHDDVLKSSVEGVAIMEAVELLESHDCIVCEPTSEICLDAAPPELVDEIVSSSGSNTNGSSGSNGNKGKSAATSQEMSKDDLRTFAKFVHHCTLPSKDKAVEELRNAHKDITSSRAQATRKLDSIATKQKHPMGGVVWVVKEDILRDLGLDELAEKKLEQPLETKMKTTKGKSAETKQQIEAKAKSPVSVAKDTERKMGGTSSSKKKKRPSPEATNAEKKTGVSSSSKKKKRPAPKATKASAKLFASFLKKQKTK